MWGYFYVVDNVKGKSYLYDYPFGKHLLDYSEIAFATEDYVDYAPNYWPYTEQWHYSKFLVSPYTTGGLFVVE